MKTKQQFYYIFCIVTLALVIQASVAFSQEDIEKQDASGLRIEELITDKGTWKLELGVSLSVISQDKTIGAFETIQTGEGEFVDVPVALGSSKRQVDTLILSFGGRYGITDKTELYSRLSLIYDDSRVTRGIIGTTTTNSSGRFSALTFGLNHRFQEDGENFGLIGFADISVAENMASSGTDLAHGKSGTLGLTAYQVFDPVVVSVTGGYRPKLRRFIGPDAIDPGDTLFINPSVAFAVNNEITLTGGVSMHFTGADEVNGTEQGTRTTRGDFEFSVAHSLDQDTSLQFNTKAGSLGDSNFMVGLRFVRNFDK